MSFILGLCYTINNSHLKNLFYPPFPHRRGHFNATDKHSLNSCRKIGTDRSEMPAVGP